MEFPPPGSGGAFQGGLLQPDYKNQTAQYVSYEYQDIIGRLIKLEMMLGQQLNFSDEMKSLLTTMEARVTESLRIIVEQKFESFQNHLIEVIDSRLSSPNNGNQNHSIQQEDQLSTPIFSHKATSLPHKVSISESNGQDTLFDPLDIPTFDFSSLAHDNYSQKAENHQRVLSAQDTPRSFPLPKTENILQLHLEKVPVFLSLTKRLNDFESDSRAFQVSSKVTPFSPFFNTDLVNKGIRDGQLFVGVLSINKKNRQEATATIETDSGVMKVLILGENARNRSLEGDIVVIKLNDKKLWDSRKPSKRTPIPLKHSSFTYAAWKPKKSLMENTSSLEVFSNYLGSDGVQSFAAITSKRRPNGNVKHTKLPTSATAFPTGKVVAILNEDMSHGIRVRSITRRAGQLIVGSLVPRYGFDNPKLTKNEPLPKSENTVEFRPLDNRFPFLMIQREELPKQFVQNPFSFKSPTEKLVVCSIRGWFENFRFPLGRFVKVLGNTYNVTAETEALINETSFYRNTEAFTENVLSKIGKKSIRLESGRADFREENLFSICSDFESIQVAFHCKPMNEEGTVFEVGVHIADVSSFITEDSSIDIEAFHRCCKVFLVNADLPLLPPTLTHDLCSLLPGQDRYCLSVVFHINSEGERVESVETRYTKSIIRNKALLNVQTASSILDQVSKNRDISMIGLEASGDGFSGIIENLHVSGDFSKKAISRSIQKFLLLGKRRNQLRFHSKPILHGDIFDGQTCSLPCLRVRFVLDRNGEPTRVKSTALPLAYEIVQEYERFANFLVAERIVLHSSETALLLKQSPPEMDEENLLWQVLALFGLPDPRIKPISQETFVKVFENIKARQMMESIKGPNSENSKLFAKLVQNFTSIDPDIAFSLLTYLMKETLPNEKYEVPSSNSLAINGNIGIEDGHWYHNVPYYTTFTKPFDSYVDIIVQRLLHLSLDEDRSNVLRRRTDYVEQIKSKLAIVSEHCNARISDRNEAQRRSRMLFLCSLLRKRAAQKNMIETTAVVTKFGKKNIYLFLVEFNLLCKVNVFVDWHAENATTVYHDGGFLVYKVDSRDETKILEPSRDLIERTKEKATVSMKLKFSRNLESEFSFGLVIKVFLKPQVERKRVLGFRTDFIRVVNKKQKIRQVRH